MSCCLTYVTACGFTYTTFNNTVLSESKLADVICNVSMIELDDGNITTRLSQSR